MKLLIFDLDGTLVDSSVNITCALNYAIEPHGVGKIGVEETITLIGEGLTRLIGKVIESRGGGLNQAELLGRFLNITRPTSPTTPRHTRERRKPSRRWPRSEKQSSRTKTKDSALMS